MGFHSPSASSEIGSFGKEAGLLGRESDGVDEEDSFLTGGDEADEEDNKGHPFTSSKGL